MIKKSSFYTVSAAIDLPVVSRQHKHAVWRKADPMCGWKIVQKYFSILSYIANPTFSAPLGVLCTTS